MCTKEKYIEEMEGTFIKKNPGIMGFQYDKSNPRATTCLIAFRRYNPKAHTENRVKLCQCMGQVYFVVGVAIRNKKDPEDEVFACKLAFKRAKKQYYKKIRAMEPEKHDRATCN